MCPGADAETDVFGVFYVFSSGTSLKQRSLDAYPGMAGDSCAGRANSVKARARERGDLRSALTEFAPVLRCIIRDGQGF